MKITPVFVWVSLILFFNLSCKSEEEKQIQSEFSKLNGVWNIDLFRLENATSAQNDLIKTGTVIFHNCVYNSKNASAFKEGALKCGSELQIGNLIFSCSYSYDYDKRLFTNFFLSETSEQFRNNVKYLSNRSLINSVFEGDWDIAVVGDKMTAKQVKNKALKDIQISFNATRQP